MHENGIKKYAITVLFFSWSLNILIGMYIILKEYKIQSQIWGV